MEKRQKEDGCTNLCLMIRPCDKSEMAAVGVEVLAGAWLLAAVWRVIIRCHGNSEYPANVNMHSPSMMR